MLGTTIRFADGTRMTRRLLQAALVVCAIAAFLPDVAHAACTAREAAREASRYGQVVAVYQTDGGFWVRILDNTGNEQDIFIPFSAC